MRSPVALMDELRFTEVVVCGVPECVFNSGIWLRWIKIAENTLPLFSTFNFLFSPIFQSKNWLQMENGFEKRAIKYNSCSLLENKINSTWLCTYHLPGTMQERIISCNPQITLTRKILVLLSYNIPLYGIKSTNPESGRPVFESFVIIKYEDNRNMFLKIMI